jgi:cobalt-zinc-cadmium efflux system membrane fusion protein
MSEQVAIDGRIKKALILTLSPNGERGQGAYSLSRLRERVGVRVSWLSLAVLSLLTACESHEQSNEHAAQETVAKGPHGGRLLTKDNFAIELAIFESGVPPEYHAWPTVDGKAVPLDQVQLTVELTRLGGKIDKFSFAPQGDYLRGDGVVMEPHSFIVKVSAQHGGLSHEWTYDSFEGRTRIAPDVAATAGIATEVAGPATLTETLSLHGRIAADPSRRREVTARFPGVVRDVHKNVGDRIAAGDTLATVESNESLQTYSVTAPIAGVIASRHANPGEQSADHVLFTIVDSSRVMAELSVFPRDRSRVRRGANVTVRLADSDIAATGKIERIDVQADSNQSLLARVALDNRNGEWVVGSFVTGDVSVAERQVPLAVKTSGLQPFRDFTVVFEQIGDQYEVRMLELGEQHGEWAEVLSGIEPGAQYVTRNSYLIKADIEKSGASHDH